MNHPTQPIRQKDMGVENAPISSFLLSTLSHLIPIRVWRWVAHWIAVTKVVKAQSNMHTPYLSVLVHHNIIQPHKKYTKKCVNSRQKSLNRSKWTNILHSLCHKIHRSEKKKVHRRRLWLLWVIWAMPTCWWLKISIDTIKMACLCRVLTNRTH